MKPDYNGGSIVNLMSSLGKKMGFKSRYKGLKLLDNEDFNSKNMVLFMIDGLGFNFLREQEDSFLYEYLKGSMTSVFPSTTAAAVTSFYTGVAPQQHAVTGWNMKVKEVGSIVKFLPFYARGGLLPLNERGVTPDMLLDEQPLFAKIDRSCFNIIPSEISSSAYNKLLSENAKVLGYTTLTGFFKQVSTALNNDGKKFVYAYWPSFDTYSHEFGANSEEALEHFKELDKEFRKFVERMPEDTTIIVTSDHGMVDVAPENIVIANEHEELMDMLSDPLCGESRCAYCYVKSSRRKDFVHYMEKNFPQLKVYKSEELVKKNFFGLFEPNKRFLERIGDYVVLPNKGHAFADVILGEQKDFFFGKHGGVTEDEMLVPLILFKK